jgi:molybdenum cofactor biosynthesis protein B
MVDFQQRDTRRGLSDDDGPGRNGTRADDGEAELDEVRQQLEERPSESEDDHEGGTGADESEDDGNAADDHEDDEASDDHEAHGDDHHHEADVETLGAAVVTISSSRTMDDDPSGDYIVSSMVDAGHDVVTRELIADDLDGIQSTVGSLVERSDVDVVVTTGGTGVTPDDRTVEAVRPLFEKELPGFGELFRSLSYDDIGSRIVATRATAGVADGVPVFCLPGSTNAVQLGVEEIVVDVAPHLSGLASPEGGHGHEHGDHAKGRQGQGRSEGREGQSRSEGRETDGHSEHDQDPDDRSQDEHADDAGEHADPHQEHTGSDEPHREDDSGRPAE